MNIFKHIQILVLVLAPACLVGAAQPSSAWVKEALSCQQSESWIVVDKTGKKVRVDGEVISNDSKIISSGAYIDVLNTMADVMQVPDLELARSYPLINLNPLLLCVHAKLYYQGKQFRDWIYESYISRIDEALLNKNDSVHFIFTVRELDSEKLLGIVMFEVGKDHVYGTVELGPLAVTQEARGRGLSNVLSCSILKLLPQANRIILEALCSNTKAIDIYKTFGFTQYQRDDGKLNIFVRHIKSYVYAYEYQMSTSRTFQDCAAKFVPVRS